MFDSTPQFNSMLDECLPKNVDGVNIKGVFALFANKDKKIISSTNKNYEVDSYLNIDDDLNNNKKHHEKHEWQV